MADILITTLTNDQALAFANFLKRAGFDDYYRRAFSEHEAYLMLEASEIIRGELKHAGFDPR